ncbi:AAA family ATPase [Halosegnis sp.]|uniref:AAA family ATPase n=1 Tax=Halosegnis sp. TaxID=2864959 RepID=UPI0035D40EB5
MSEQAVRLPVEAAEKRDAGRGVARLPEAARATLGVLSGDTVVVEGDRQAAAKVWPGTESGIVRIDADTRANAGVTVGDEVTVRRVAVSDADRVRVALEGDAPENAEKLLRHALLDRPLQVGDTIRVERAGLSAEVVDTDPEGVVKPTEGTTVSVRHSGERSARPTLAADTEDTAVDAPEPTDRGVTYEDIGGLDEELELVRETIELPLTQPELFREVGVDPPKGVLLYGPPGTGKTLIARAVANEVNAAFRVINGPEIVSKYKGDSEERLRTMFEEAADNQPAVVFIDELDAIAGERDEDADMENRLVAQLLTLLDGLEERGQVIVIGATNRVDAVDPALRRGGRFDREIEIGAPSESGRREILDVHTRDMELADDVDLDRLAARTHGFVGADVRTLTQEAALAALRDRETRDTLAVTRADFETALAAVEPSAMREYVAEAPTVDFSDVGGLAEAKATLREAVEWPALYAPLFEAAETDPASGVLLYGPPGTGKTLLARAVAGETGVNFIHVAGPELLDRYVGESERAVRELFDRARQAAPAVVFLDEIDAIAGIRGAATDADVTERVVSQLLTELDNAASNPRLVVLAATNRREDLDPALLRPGRLETHVEVPAPDEQARREVLAVHTEGKPLADDVDLDALAAATAGFSGAELAALVREASMHAIRAVAAERDPETANARADELTLTADAFEAAMDRVADDA